MSIKVMTHVWEHSKQGGTDLLLLLAIADHCHDDGTGAYPSVSRLSHKCRMGVRNTQYVINKLVESGELIVHKNAGPKGTNLYQIPLDFSAVVQSPAGVQTLHHAARGANGRNKGVQSSVEVVQALAYKPSEEPSEEPSEREPAGKSLSLLFSAIRKGFLIACNKEDRPSMIDQLFELQVKQYAEQLIPVYTSRKYDWNDNTFLEAILSLNNYYRRCLWMENPNGHSRAAPEHPKTLMRFWSSHEEYCKKIKHFL